MSTFKIAVDKASHTYEVDFDAMPEVSRNRVIAYGLTQLLSDAAASVATTANIEGRRVPLKGNDLAKAHMAAKALTDHRIADLSAGILRRAREGDPVSAEAKRIAIRLVNKSDDYRKWLAKSGNKPGDKDATAELAKRAEVRAADPKVIALAQAHVDALAELEE